MRFWSLGRGLDLIDAGEKMRRFHERWLTKAVSRPGDVTPRIPVRRVDEGGYQTLLASPGGRERAEQWWYDAFALMDADE
jgi:hypothetical protein